MQQDQKSQPPVAAGSPNANAFRQWVQRAMETKRATVLLNDLKNMSTVNPQTGILMFQDLTPHLFETGHALFADAEHKIDLRADWVGAVDALCLALQDWMEDAPTARAECAALRAGDLLAFFLFRAAVQTLAVLDAVDSQRAHAKRIRDAWEQIERVWSARGVLFHHQLVRNLPFALRQMKQHVIRYIRREDRPDYAALMADLLKDHAEYLQLPEEKRRAMAFSVPGIRPELNDFTNFLTVSLPHLLTANQFQQVVYSFFGSNSPGGGSPDEYFRSADAVADDLKPQIHLAARWVASIGAVSALGFPKDTFRGLYLSALKPTTHANLVDDVHLTMATLAPDLYVCIRRAWALAAPQPLPLVPTPTKSTPSLATVDLDGKKITARLKFNGVNPTGVPSLRAPTYLLFPLGRDAHTQLGALRQKLQELTPAAYRSFFSLYESGGEAPKEPTTLLETLADDAMEALRKDPKDALAHARMDAVRDFMREARGVEEAWRKDGLDLTLPIPSARLATLRNALYLAGPFRGFLLQAHWGMHPYLHSSLFDRLVEPRVRLVELYWPTRLAKLRLILRNLVPWMDKEEAAWTALEQKAAAAKSQVKWNDVAATLALDEKQPMYPVAQAAFGLPLPGESLTLLDQVKESDSFRTHWIELGLWTPSMRVAPDKKSVLHYTQATFSSKPYFARLASFHPGFLYAATRGRGVNKQVPVAPEPKESYEQWWQRAAAYVNNWVSVPSDYLESWQDPYADYTNERLERLYDRLRMYTARFEFQSMPGFTSDVSSIVQDYLYTGGWSAAWSARFARRTVVRK
jgi:hypothetical protein